MRAGLEASLEHYTDPLPQSLVLTAIVIGFATSALFLVVLLALRGLSGTDHVDGAEPALPAPPPEATAGPASAFFQTYEADAGSTLGKEEDAAAPAPSLIVLDSTLASADAALEATTETPTEQSPVPAEKAGDAPDTAIILAEARTP